jgi:hypothetical protein
MEGTTQYFGKRFFYKQVLEFHCPSKFLCPSSGRQNHWSLVQGQYLPMASGGDLQFFYTFIVTGSIFTLRHIPTTLAEVTIYPGVGGGMGLTAIFQLIRFTIYPTALPHNISRGHYLPCKINCFFRLLSRPLFALCP